MEKTRHHRWHTFDRLILDPKILSVAELFYDMPFKGDQILGLTHDVQVAFLNVDKVLAGLEEKAEGIGD